MGIATSFKVESANLEELHVDFVLLRSLSMMMCSAGAVLTNDIFSFAGPKLQHSVKTAQNCAKYLFMIDNQDGYYMILWG